MIVPDEAAPAVVAGSVVLWSHEDGEPISEIGWMVLQEFQTTCSYSALRPITPPKPLSALRRRSGDRQVSDDLIRPYAICHTPSFLA